ncbi:MAG TPA: glycoside hydrolase domain-containing protein [Bryobacteraceae bacterium]
MPRFLLAFLVTASISRGAAITWWVANPLEKVRPADPAPASPAKEADIYAARNEFEPFQIVLRAQDTIENVDVDCSSLKSARGDEIGKSNVTIYAEWYVNIARPSLAGGEPGEWPDPLIPRIDRYANEKRNAFPFSLNPARNQPLWIEVFVPETAPPGEYRGAVNVLRNGTSEFTIPVRLTVWAFTLPSTATFKTSFGLNGTTALKQHLGSYTSDDDLYAITCVYAKAALLHRISIHGGSQTPPKFQYSGGQIHVDWARYDAEVGPFLDGTILPSGPLRGARATTIDLRTPGAFESPERRSLYLSAWMKHFQQKGWSDRLFLYLWDEPTLADFPKVLSLGRGALATDPRIRDLVTVPYTSKLADVVQIWTPLINCLERKADGDDFCQVAATMDDYAREMRGGKSVWFYQSCASHGCNVPGGDYFRGWPSYMIDASGPANRVMPWVAWKYGIQGELYYSMNEAYGHGDAWVNFRLAGGNGDGTLFYPGTPSKIGGHTNIPIESIRLKLIREGMEDYEYLALLGNSSKPAASQFVDRIVAKTYSWESRPEVFLRVRRELGEALNRLAESPESK